jgi:hypothetical protein
MEKHLNGFLVFFLVCVVAASCEKEIASLPEEVPSLFNLPAPGAAGFHIVTGSDFIVGRSLTGNEMVEAQTRVTRSGNWSFSTDTLNGFYFSGKGSFTDTGKQVISLKAGGMPASPGNYKFTIKKDSLKTDFIISVLKGDVALEPVPFKRYFKGIIGGITYYVEEPLPGPDDIVYSSGGSDTASFGGYVSPGIYPNPPGTGTLSLQKNFIYNYYTSTLADFKKLFAPGAYPLAIRQGNTISAGLIIYWSDSDSVVWSTMMEGMNQEGSSYAITGIEEGYDKKGIYFVKVKSKFNCKLYNMRTKEMKELQDGESVTYFKAK